jgi:hypothetical protein
MTKPDTVDLTLHLTLPVAQLEAVLAQLRAYTADPRNPLQAWIDVDLRQARNEAAVVALLQRQGLPVVVGTGPTPPPDVLRRLVEERGDA